MVGLEQDQMMSVSVSSKRWLLSLVIGTILGVVIFVVIIAWVGLEEVWRQRRGVDLALLVVYLGISVVTYVLRAWRFRLLLGVSGAMPKLFGIVSVHTLMLNLLPSGAGDVSYPLLLRRYGISSGFLQGVPSILIARLQDAFVYGLFLLVALVWTGNVGLAWRWFLGGIQLGTVLLALAVGFAVVLLWRRFGTRLRVVRNVARLLPEIASSFRAISASVWAGTFLLTFSTRFASFIAVVFLYQSLGLSLPLATVFLITSLYVFLPYIPVSTPAGIGITEGFLVALFVYGGIDRGVAAAASIQVHLLQLLVGAILAAVGFIALQYLQGRDRRRGLVLS